MSEPNLETAIFVHLTDASAGLVFYEPLSDWPVCRPERCIRKFCQRCREDDCREAELMGLRKAKQR